MKRPEILSPCGGAESLPAAVLCGADAVYLGASGFSARKSAANFNDQELDEAVRYCHGRGVKVHLALNTLVFDKEYDQALSLAARACEIGVDAVIVQDLGLIAALRRCAPSLPLHGSTQMSVHNPAGVRALERMGLRRAVLARELSLEEIAAIRRATGLELEVFVHGALCMCLSGQCTMSAVIGGRSGNRGACAQPCRLPFTSPAGEYALSLKDLCVLDWVDRLGEIGVDSFKIEGRMKRPEYVAAATAAYKAAVLGKPTDPEILDGLRSVFSRGGFTDGYLSGKRNGEMFGVRGREDVAASAKVLPFLAGLYHKEAGRFPVDFTLTARAGQPLALLAREGEGKARITGMVPEAAVNRPADPERVAEQLSKTGGTPFLPGKIKVELDPGLALSLSEINRLRREALEALSGLRSQPKPVNFDFSRLPPTLPEGPAADGRRLTVRFERGEQIADVPADTIVVPLALFNHPAAAALSREKGALELPRAIFSEEPVKKQLAAAYAAGWRRAVCGNLGALELAREAGFELLGDFGLNVVSSRSLEAVRALGVTEQALSFEMTAGQVVGLKQKGMAAALVYGRLPLMLTRSCPVRKNGACGGCRGISELTDRMGEKFPVVCRDKGFVEILNCRPLWVLDRLQELPAGAHVLYFTLESPEECRRIEAAYRRGAAPEGAYTRGLYYRPPV